MGRFRTCLEGTSIGSDPEHEEGLRAISDVQPSSREATSLLVKDTGSKGGHSCRLGGMPACERTLYSGTTFSGPQCHLHLG